jgi:hypothetical protein
VAAFISCSSGEPPEQASLPAAAIAPDGGAPTTSLTAQLSPGIIVRSEVRADGDIRTEITEESTRRVLAFALATRAKGEWSYSLPKTLGDSQRGDVRTEPLGSDVTLAASNDRLVARFQADDGPALLALDEEQKFGAPGCDFVDWWIDGSQHCAQDCCADLGGCFALYDCSTEDWLPPVSKPPKLDIPDPQDIACKACMIQGLACMGKCGLLPESLRGDNYGDCAFGEHRCFDVRCMDPWDTWKRNPTRGLPSVNFYCAQNCYTDPSPCDLTSPGEVWCSGNDNDDNDCRDAYGRKGFYALSCDPNEAVTTCECERQGLVRCKDDRCDAGKNGYCSRTHPTAILDRNIYGGCDPSDTNNPCCGGGGQPCCEGQCEAMSLICDGGNGQCEACGDLGQRPCMWGCELGLEEIDGTCQLNCGGSGEACCGGVCGIGLSCKHPTDTGICGFWDTFCSDRPSNDPNCRGTTFNHTCGTRQPPQSEFRCGPCGHEGQICCGSGNCNLGLFCDGTCKRMRPGQEPDEPEPPPPGSVDLIVQVRDGVACADPGEALISNIGDADAGPFGVGALNIGQCTGSPRVVPPGRIFTCPGVAAHNSIRLRSCRPELDATQGCQNLGWRILLNADERLDEADFENNTALCTR